MTQSSDHSNSSSDNPSETQTCAQLVVKCLLNEGVKHIFALPGEENAEMMMALDEKKDEISVHIVRHESGAAFMAAGFSRFSDVPGVLLGTLGPGATNMITGVADAHQDRVPLVAITAQGATTRVHKESHQIMDIIGLFRPLTKWNSPIRNPESSVEVIRKCFKVATTEKLGATHFELYEDIAKKTCDASVKPMAIHKVRRPVPDDKVIGKAWDMIKQAKSPVILAGNGTVRKDASKQLTSFSRSTGINVMNSFAGKGCIPYTEDTCLFTVGLQSDDYTNCVLAKSDLIITIGYDMNEYHPHLWNPKKDKKILHMDFVPAEIDEHYDVELEVVGEPSHTLWRLNEIQKTDPVKFDPHRWKEQRDALLRDFEEYKDDTQEGVLRPQKVLYDTRQVLAADDILFSDVGAIKMWIARYYQCIKPNTCIISNGFCSMGGALPGAIGASIANPGKKIWGIAGDGGFLMNVQEMETAKRLKSNIAVMVWEDKDYGLISWKQDNSYGKHVDMSFTNPDWMQLAEAFGWTGLTVNKSKDLKETLQKAQSIDGPVLIHIPIDYRENGKLTKKLGNISVHL